MNSSCILIFRPVPVFIPSAFKSAEVDCRLTRLHKTVTMLVAWHGCEMRCFKYMAEIKLQKTVQYRRLDVREMTYIQDSAVGIATHYRLGGLGIESRYRRDFPHPFTQSLWSKQPLVQWVPGFFPGSKAAGAWRWPPTPFSTEGKERVEL